VRGYGVHLLFHVLAALLGVGCGASAALWWFAGTPSAREMLVGAALLGVLLLVLQGVYIGISKPKSARGGRPYGRRSDARTGAPPPGTRPDLEPVDPDQHQASQVLDERSANPPTHRY
jgi:hypothetical protein